MEDGNYECRRDAVYVGKVVQATSKTFFSRYELGEVNSNIELLSVKNGCTLCRNILFTPDNNKLATDLIYNSPHYKVINVTSGEKCLRIEEGEHFIDKAANIGNILSEFGFGEWLTHDDISLIRNIFFGRLLSKESSDLFGARSTRSIWAGGETDFETIHTLIGNGIYEFKLPFDEYRDKPLSKALKEHIVGSVPTNSFKPHSSEGIISKNNKYIYLDWHRINTIFHMLRNKKLLVGDIYKHRELRDDEIFKKESVLVQIGCGYVRLEDLTSWLNYHNIRRTYIGESGSICNAKNFILTTASLNNCGIAYNEDDLYVDSDSIKPLLTIEEQSQNLSIRQVKRLVLDRASQPE